MPDALGAVHSALHQILGEFRGSEISDSTREHMARRVEQLVDGCSAHVEILTAKIWQIRVGNLTGKDGSSIRIVAKVDKSQPGPGSTVFDTRIEND